MNLEIIKPIGEVVAYRDALKKKYVVHGYLCKHVGDPQKPTTTDPEEQATKTEWVEISTAVKRFQNQIDLLMRDVTLPITDDSLQSRIHNYTTSLTILKEAFENTV